MSDGFHRIDHLVGRNAAFDPGKSHVGTGYRVDGAKDISLDAGNLDKARDGIAGKAEEPLQGKGRSLTADLRASAFEKGKGSSCHR